MKSIKQYITESHSEYAYTVKMAMDMTDDTVDMIKQYLNNYGLMYIGKPIKHENDKFDFFDVTKQDVYSINFITNMPLSSYLIQQQLRSILNVPEKFIVVRTATEPVEVYAEYDEFVKKSNAEAKDEGLNTASMLSISQFYNDAEQPLVDDIFGDEYNKKFLQYLASIKATRDSNEIEAESPLFGWIDMKKLNLPNTEMTDFNANYDTPKPVYDKVSDIIPVTKHALGQNGNFDDGVLQNVKLYIDPKTGKRSAKTEPRAMLKQKGN